MRPASVFSCPYLPFKQGFWKPIRPLHFAINLRTITYALSAPASAPTSTPASPMSLFDLHIMVSFCLFPWNHNKTLFSFHDFDFSIWCSLFGVNDFVYFILYILICVHYFAVFQKWPAFPFAFEY